MGGLLTSQLGGYCGPNHPLNNLDQFKDKTRTKSIRRQTVVNKVLGGGGDRIMRSGLFFFKNNNLKVYFWVFAHCPEFRSEFESSPVKNSQRDGLMVFLDSLGLMNSSQDLNAKTM